MPPTRSTAASTASIVSPEVHRSIVNKVRATTLHQLLDQLKTQFWPQLAAVAFIVWLSWDNASKLHLAVWVGTQAVAIQLVEIWAFFHARRHPIRDDQLGRWEYFIRAFFLLNSSYGAYAYYAFALGGPREELFLLFMVGLMYTLAQFSRADVKAACAMVVPIYVGMLAAHLSRGTERDFIMAAMLTLAFAALLALVLQQSKQAFEALYARFLNEELAEVLKKKHDELARAKREVEAASQAKSRFFAAASHDLRQPLHALSLLFGSVQGKVKQQNVQPAMQQMEAALSSLESLFSDVLDVARLESGKVDVRLAAVSSARLFEQLEREFTATASAKGLPIRFRGPGLFLETDEVLLKRMLGNLLSNAIKYTDRGGILVACRRSGQGTATLQVFDTGIGIPPTELEHVFEDFYQVLPLDPARQRQREGIGLGLGIVKRLADLLHHRVEVRSRPGRGSMFALRVPLSQRARASPAARAKSDRTQDLSLSGRSILVVDDQEIVVNAITTLLTDWGGKVLTATSKVELQRALSGLGSAPDFLIVDYQFEPSFSGEDVIELVRENFHWTTIPAAIMTGNAALVPQRAIQSGQVHVFAKPVSAAKLRALLHFNLILSGRIAAVPSRSDPPASQPTHRVNPGH